MQYDNQANKMNPSGHALINVKLHIVVTVVKKY
jgi:hypothetical protein